MIYSFRNLLAFIALLAPVFGPCMGITQAKETLDKSAPTIQGLARLRVSGSSVEERRCASPMPRSASPQCREPLHPTPPAATVCGAAQLYPLR